MSIKNSKKRFIYAYSIFVGTIIGVGLFGLPYVGSRAGYPLLLFYLIVVGAFAVTINFFYATISAHTKGLHRLPGYAKIYLGENGKRIAFIVKTLALFGALLAYLIIGGQFLSSLFGGPVYLYTFIFFILGSFLIWRDQKSVGPVEVIMLIMFFIIVFFMFITGASNIKAVNLSTFNASHFFAPYGIVLFSLWGTSIIPEVKEQLRGNLHKIKLTVFWGIMTAVVVSVIFSTLVIGISGAGTSEDALSGMEGILGSWALNAGYFFGAIAAFTSYIALGLTVKKIFWYDYGLNRHVGWLLASFIPLGLYIVGLQSFIEVVSITGAVMLGIDGVIVTLIFLKIRAQQDKRKKHKHTTALKFGGTAMILLLSLGVILEVLYFLKII